MKPSHLTCLALSVLLVAGCTRSTPTTQSGANSPTTTASNTVNTTGSEPVDAEVDMPLVTLIEPGPNAHTEAQEALILAEPGEVIEFAAGRFDFNGTLSLDGVKNITIRGQGMEKTILNFTGQQAGSGGEGLKIHADNVTIHDLTIEDTPGDALKIEDSNRVTVRRVKTWWTKGPDEKNGAYGIYPVLCSDVLVEHCVAEGASDAGIYVGQTERAVVRYNRAERNVAGIEIENTVGVDVYENEARNNSGGLLVFSLPGLKLKNGSHCRVYKNRLYDNNHPNFAQAGSMVSTVPPGTGLMIMANDHVEVFENDIHGNSTTNCAVVSFFITDRQFQDPEYDPYPEAIHIHDNKFADGGTAPQGKVAEMYEQLVGLPVPDIVIDGIFDPAKLADGKLPEELAISIVNNGEATFANLGLGAMQETGVPAINNDLGPFAGKLARLPPVSLPGVE